MKLGLNGRFLAARPTGVQRFARRIAEGVLREVPATLFVPADAEPPGDPGTDVEVHRGRARGHLWEQTELPLQARRAGCSVVLHLANTVPLWGGPHVVVVHDVTPLTHPEWYGWRYARWHATVVARAVRSAAAVLTVSEWSAGEVGRVLGPFEWPLRVVDQGPEPFDAPAAPVHVEEELNRLGITRPYLLAVGGGDARKNVGFLERVLDELARRDEEPADLSLVVVGERDRRVWAGAGERDGPGVRAGSGKRNDGPTAGEPVEAATVATTSTAERRIGLGHVTDETLRALYTGAAALCHPALEEGFGRPPLEALACGTAVLTAPYGPAEEVLGADARVLPLHAGAWAEALADLVPAEQARWELALVAESRSGKDATDRAGRREVGRVGEERDPGGSTGREVDPVVGARRTAAGRHRWEDGVETVIEACRQVAENAPPRGRAR